MCRPPTLPASLERLVLPVDKPKGWTSFDAIRRLRRILGVRKVGHAGTLDPMATGLLILLIGRATKLMNRFMTLDKEYEGTIRLGETTASFDAETDVEERRDWSAVSEDDIERARQQFLGEIEQRTPAYSAVKMGGERLYKKARRGETIEAPPRQVRIDSFQLTGRSGHDVSFVVKCSKGTYIRSLAHEFGQALGVGAHLVALRRTAIGPFTINEAWTMPGLEEAAQPINHSSAGAG
jgi:tRNA pseudouridine55 synthase